MSSVQVRYIVHDVDAAIAFYTTQLGFKLEMHRWNRFSIEVDDLAATVELLRKAGLTFETTSDRTLPADYR